MVLLLLTSCQKPEIEQLPDNVSGDSEFVKITFGVDIPDDDQATKAFGAEHGSDIENLYVVVFDENGYYIDTHQAEIVDPGKDHDAHKNERKYSFQIRKTEKERILHFIANCPVEEDGKLNYGHERDVIGNLFVSRDGGGPQTAYWYRMEVWYIQEVPVDEGNPEGEKMLDPAIAEKFKCIPLLRNYASITVENKASDFEMESYAIYNTIDRGTVAPYCAAHHDFQLFHEGDKMLTYADLTTRGYGGHALASATLKTTLTDADFVSPDTPTYMYERKISVKTNQEHLWSESPAHIIIKGRYAGAAAYSYYKVDMVWENNNKSTYYNILRNFKYKFVLNSVAGSGYATLQEAMDNPAGNNLSGSTDTQGFTNISDGVGRIFVSYTDTTLVSSNSIKLKYKYVPRIDQFTEVANERVSVSGILDGTGSVLKNIVKTDYNVGDGWAEVTFAVQEPGAVTHIQEVDLIVSDNGNLHKSIRFRLQKPLDLQLHCYPDKVAASAGRSMNVALLLPTYLTEDMFPLDFAIEVDKLTLSPDASKDDNVMPVNPAESIIPGKEGINTFHFIKSIETYEQYLALQQYQLDGITYKLLSTYWLTNKAQNASWVYAYNKYFTRDKAKDEFTNVHGFTLLDFPDGVMEGIGNETVFEFNMNFLENVTVTLEGLVNLDGKNTFVYTPDKLGRQSLTLKTNQDKGTVKVKLEAASHETAEYEEEQISEICIDKLVITFTHNSSSAPKEKDVIPTLSLSEGNITWSSRTPKRQGNRRPYTYTVTYENVVITGANLNSTLIATYTYGSFIYRGSATLETLKANPTLTMTP